MVLYEAIVKKPIPGKDDVLVRVHGASVGGGEVMIRAGKIAWVSGHKFPRASGVDFAGEIVETGPSVVTFAPRDRVWGLMPHGMFGSIAEFVAVPASRVTSSPRGLDLLKASALPAAGTTAITALRIHAGLRNGERLLVRGASGGVGSIAVQLGKAMGAHVTGLASARNLDWVRQLGADRVVDYARIKAVDLGHFDVVLDVVGTKMESYRRLLARGGRMVGIAFDPDHLFRTLIYLMSTSVFGSRRVRAFSNDPDQAIIAELRDYVESGVIRPLVDKFGCSPRSRRPIGLLKPAECAENRSSGSSESPIFGVMLGGANNSPYRPTHCCRNLGEPVGTVKSDVRHLKRFTGGRYGFPRRLEAGSNSSSQCAPTVLMEPGFFNKSDAARARISAIPNRKKLSLNARV